MPLEIVQIPALSDNYNYLLRDSASGQTAVVDPSQSAPTLAALQQLGWSLGYILNTHHHADHVGGNLPLKQATGCKIVGYGPDAERIPGIDIELRDGDRFALGESVAAILFVPGHTLGHIAYHFTEDKALFCGDTLFALGCGRLFEGTPAQMQESLARIATLPDDTRIYCAHEYTLSNAKFALQIEPENQALRARVRAVEALRREGKPTVPSLLAEEKATNPFLRWDSEDIRARIGKTASDSVADVFGEVRHLKDVF